MFEVNTGNPNSGDRLPILRCEILIPSAQFNQEELCRSEEHESLFW